MARTYLLDSNSVIDYLMARLPPSGMTFLDEVVDNIPNVSVITKIEVLGFPMPTADETVFRDFFNDSNVYYLTLDIVEKTIEIRKNYRLKVPDALIAATALVQDFDIISRNLSDFNRIPNLTVIDPHNLP
jgi:predicted nucleic acid-binding protein